MNELEIVYQHLLRKKQFNDMIQLHDVEKKFKNMV